MIPGPGWDSRRSRIDFLVIDACPAPPTHITIRLPDGLRDRIKKLATRNGRSANSEIVAFIEQGIKKPTEADERLARIEAKLDALLSRMDGK